MPAHEVDISWPVLRRIVQEWAGTSAELAEVKPLDGGSINTTLALTTHDGAKCVLKISPHRVDRSHEQEAHQLKLLREIGLPVPSVYAWSLGTLEQPFSYVLIEFIEGVDFARAKLRCASGEYESLQEHLAEIVLTMHAHTNDCYQRVIEGTPTFDRWPAFYRDIYDAIFQEAGKSPLMSTKCRKQLDKIHERLDRLLAHDDVPRLVHWDLWASNLLAKPDAQGRWRIAGLLDPNCKYGHAEAEIAYLELFHTVTPTFLKAYQQSFKLSGDYHRVRKPVYQLYELINHLQLFGQEYVKPMTAAIERVLPLV